MTPVNISERLSEVENKNYYDESFVLMPLFTVRLYHKIVENEENERLNVNIKLNRRSSWIGR